MTGFDRVPAERIARLAPLFAGRRELRAVVDGVLDGGLGVAHADDPGRPRCARLDVGCYAIFGGEASAAAARAMVEAVTAPRELVFGGDDGWRALIAEAHGERLVPRPMQEYDPTALDAGRLRRLAAAVPPGYVVEPLGPRLAARLGPELQPHALQVFADAGDFARRGLGFGALHDDVLACAASSYTISSGSLELAIATHPAHRGRGLGRAVAARLAAEALARGLLPHWSAANPVSRRMARALGYTEAGVCEALVLE